jgi:hypothetical protein
MDDMNIKEILDSLYRDLNHGWFINKRLFKKGKIGLSKYMVYNSLELLKFIFIILLLIAASLVLPLYLVFKFIKEKIG